jgi:hypothetical protein
MWKQGLYNWMMMVSKQETQDICNNKIRVT